MDSLDRLMVRFIAVVGVILVLDVFATYRYNAKFEATCAEAGGKAVYDGRQNVCLKGNES